jgi:hypothetical protein
MHKKNQLHAFNLRQLKIKISQLEEELEFSQVKLKSENHGIILHKTGHDLVKNGQNFYLYLYNLNTKCYIFWLWYNMRRCLWGQQTTNEHTAFLLQIYILCCSAEVHPSQPTQWRKGSL